MRKNRIGFWTICALAITLCSCTDKKENDLDTTGLKGNVRYIREISYEAFGNADTLVQGGIIDRQGSENSFTSYNEKGYITDIVKYDQNNEVKYKWRFHYEKNGTKQISAKRYQAKDGQNDSTSYSYDKHGNATLYIRYDQDGKIKNRTLSDYNKNGKVVAEKVFSWDNLVQRSASFKYKKGKLIEGKSYDGDGKLLVRSLYSYDKKGNMLSMTMADGKNKPISRGTYTYNEDGFVSTELLLRPGYTDLLLEYIYTIDAKGNWIQRIMVSGNEAYIITKRQITYY